MPFQEKKKPSSIHSLLDDLLISCLARVSRLYYPNLSLVSKRFRSLLNSPELYATRSSLGNLESCVYVCISYHLDPNPRWFTLCLKPNPNLTNKKRKKKKKEPSGYVLAPISVQDSPPTHPYRLVSIGSNIYNIGGSINKEPSSSVSILDCRDHTWSNAPNMNVDRYYPHANVVGGKIYVTDGFEDCTESNWMEVFDPKTQTWELVISPICLSVILKTTVVDGKIYIIDGEADDSFSYEPREGKWEKIVRTGIEYGIESGWPNHPHCVIENTFYYYSYGEMFLWYNFEVRQWRYVIGLKGLPTFAPLTRVTMANYGGKLVVFWYLPSSGSKKNGSKKKKKTKIWCAVIELEKRNGGEKIWGKVEWLDLVLTVPHSYGILCAIAATV